MAAYDWSLNFGSAAFLYIGVIVSFVTVVLKEKTTKNFRLSPQWGEKNSNLIAGDNFKTYYPSSAVSSQSAKTNSDSKSPRIPLKPHSSSSSFSSSSSLAPLCSLCTAVVIKCCLRLLRITRLLLVSMRHLYKEQKGPSSWKQEVTHHSSWLCLFTQWQGLLHFSLVLLLLALYWRKWYKKTYRAWFHLIMWLFNSLLLTLWCSLQCCKRVYQHRRASLFFC